MVFVLGKKQTIIAKSKVIALPKDVFDEEIEFVEIDIRQNPRGDIADGKTFKGCNCKAFDDFEYKGQDFFVMNALLNEVFKNSMIDSVEKAFDIHFKGITGLFPIMTCLFYHAVEMGYA